jgi:threonine/homoserine/homoserine lactone efflux protein
LISVLLIENGSKKLEAPSAGRLNCSFKGGFIMDLSAPKQVTFWIAVILAVLGLLGQLATIPVLSAFSFWILLVGFILLAAGCFLKGL